MCSACSSRSVSSLSAGQALGSTALEPGDAAAPGAKEPEMILQIVSHAQNLLVMRNRQQTEHAHAFGHDNLWKHRCAKSGIALSSPPFPLPALCGEGSTSLSGAGETRALRGASV